MGLNSYSAAASSIGYDYQIRLALLKSFEINEASEVSIEALDDIELRTEDSTTLLSLKHKKINDTLSNLSIDFWKSINIWIDRINNINTPLNFLLCTTAKVSEKSLLIKITQGFKETIDLEYINKIEVALDDSSDLKLAPIKKKFKALEDSKKIDLFNRIIILADNIRINDIPSQIINDRFRHIKSEFRQNAYESLEGWWFSKVIDQMTGRLPLPLTAGDISAKLQQISELYYADNLPLNHCQISESEIDFSDYLSDTFLFVKKLQDIQIKNSQLQRCIFDYYRASNERLDWVKSRLVSSEEITRYERRLTDEWLRFKDDLEYEDSEISEEYLRKIGREIFKWSQNTNFYIRPKVTESYVTRGSFHIIANNVQDLIYWLPKPLEDY
ncbi:hypothetical protein GCM10027155_09400 [Acinetobacter apis]|uniref:ABC-three component systems C-terminal domain-containing protein n=1 Tax=Acinetobacter apis TaxID=1229165 RepID=A0A217EEU7_9GAMM|nr:ABC-three component system protein [Acinetobacter apis]SNQ29019.1 hypothetical protein SAMN05444584_0950 [Acinetobacter apis]